MYAWLFTAWMAAKGLFYIGGIVRKPIEKSLGKEYGPEVPTFGELTQQAKDVAKKEWEGLGEDNPARIGSMVDHVATRIAYFLIALIILFLIGAAINCFWPDMSGNPYWHPSIPLH